MIIAISAATVRKSFGEGHVYALLNGSLRLSTETVAHPQWVFRVAKTAFLKHRCPPLITQWDRHIMLHPPLKLFDGQGKAQAVRPRAVQAPRCRIPMSNHCSSAIKIGHIPIVV